MFKERDEFIIGELHRCHKRKEDEDHLFGQDSEQDSEQDFEQDSGKNSGKSMSVQFPPSGRAVQEKNVELGEKEVAPVIHRETKQSTLSKAHPIPFPASKKSSSVMDSLDNFSGKVDGEEDDLDGKAVEEEEEKEEGIAGKVGGEEDDLLTGEAVTALDSNPLLDSNQTPAAVDGVGKGTGRTDSDALDWRQKESSDLPSVDIGKIKSILDETAN